MDDPNLRQRGPSARPPYPSAPQSRLYPDLPPHSQSDGGPPPAGFPTPFSAPPYAAPPYAAPPYAAPPYAAPSYASQVPGAGDDLRRDPRPSRPASLYDMICQKVVIVVIASLLIAVGMGLQFWNEGRAVQTASSLAEGLKSVRHLEASPRDGRIPVARDLDDALVHVSTKLSVPRSVSDPLFKVEIQAVKLKRHVEMFQWVETEHKREYQDANGVTRTESSYEYTQEWKSAHIPSISFNSPGHQNPDKFPLESLVFEADQVFVGPFAASKSIRDRISWWQDFDVSRLHAHLLPLGSTKHKNFIYFGIPNRPQIGDFRASFAFAGLGDFANAETVSVIAKQDAGVDDSPLLSEFTTTNGGVIGFVYQGSKSSKEIFSSERKQNMLLLWALRAGGWLLIFIGIMTINDVITCLFSGIPILRDVVAMAACSFALVTSGSLSLLVMASGWIVYRPLFAGFLLCLAVLPFVLSRLGRR